MPSILFRAQRSTNTASVPLDTLRVSVAE